MKFIVNYSMDINYEVVVNARSEDEAEELVMNGDYDDDSAIVCGEEFLNVNDVRMVD